MARMLGAEMFFETLIHKGVDVVFGLPGGYVLKVYDVMRKYENKLTHVLARYEQGATHMADGYARVSGKPGVVLCTSGPAAKNTVTGIATAEMDSSKEGLNTEGVVLMEIVVDQEEMVYPMIAPGGAMNDMIMQPVDVA